MASSLQASYPHLRFSCQTNWVYVPCGGRYWEFVIRIHQTMLQLQVTCPPDCAPGAAIHAVGPNGAEYTVTVPVQCPPGGTFLVNVPMQAPQHPGLMTVTCPGGAAPGQTIAVQGPSGTIQVQVPPGVHPGAQFQVQLQLPALQAPPAPPAPPLMPPGQARPGEEGAEPLIQK